MRFQRPGYLKVRDVSASAEQRCPYCRDAIDVAEEKLCCTRCETLYHAGCWSQNGQCAVFGCRDRSTALFTRSRHADQDTWWEFLWGMMVWTSQTLGLAFLMFWPATIVCFLLLSAPQFNEFVLTRPYLLTFLLLSVGILIPVHRPMLRRREDLAQFVVTATLLFAGVWIGAELWMRAHLPW